MVIDVCGPKEKILLEMNVGNDRIDRSGSGSHCPSRNTGRGVYLCGKIKWVNHEVTAKATSTHPQGEVRRPKRRGVTGITPEAG
jgi:hypothetical protein